MTPRAPVHMHIVGEPSCTMQHLKTEIDRDWDLCCSSVDPSTVYICVIDMNNEYRLELGGQTLTHKLPTGK